MWLKSLELTGFKTFASKYEFEFAGKITAIVGPNGSGKSNIVDALRWVLGEQSFSLLRGRKTVDMIFSGSEQRPRVGMASATVLFNNDSNWLPIDFSEVAITRRAYRDGQNEYLINGQKVRLKDVSELLGTSGLAERTYTIVGQGLIDTVLSLKADDRRKLFEEAAGIGLYRSRREEALRRLETTQRNLERVDDILTELKPRLRSLERQARRAQEYELVKADLQAMLREWYGYHWHRAQYELKRARVLAHRQEYVLEKARDAHAKFDGEMATLRDNLYRVRARLNSWHRELAQLHSQREQISRDLAVSAERQRALEERRVSLAQNLTRQEEELALHEERHTAAEREVERTRTDFAEAQDQLKQVRSALQTRRQERQEAEQMLERERQQVNQLTNRRAGLTARHGELDSRLIQLRASLESANTALVETVKASQAAETQKDLAAEQLRQAQAARTKEQEALHLHLQKMADAEAERMQILNARATLDTEFARLEAQLDVIDQAEKSLTGYAEGVKILLEAIQKGHFPGARGVLTSYLDVPAEYEKAIVSALGDFAESILLEPGFTTETALKLLEERAVGRVALLPLERLAPSSPAPPPDDPDCLGLAADLVRTTAELRPALDVLLGRTWIVRDRAGAQRLLNAAPAEVVLVTLAGELFRADGPILAGSGTPSGTISRLRNRRELSAGLVAVREKISQLDSQIQEADKILSGVRLKETQHRERLHKFQQEEEEFRDHERDTDSAVETARRQNEWQALQLSELEKEVIQTEAHSHRTGEEIDRLDDEIARRKVAVGTAQERLAGLALEEVQNQVAHWTAQVAIAERDMKDAASRQGERKTVLEAAKHRIQEHILHSQEVIGDAKQLETARTSLRQKENEIGAKISALQVMIDPAEKELETSEQAQETLQRTEAEARQALTVAERHHAQAQIGLARAQEALESLRRRIEDDFGLVAFQYEEDVAGPTPLPLGEMVETLPVVQALSPELDEALKRQRAQLRRIGPVNPDAQKEYKEVKERFEFTTNQIADLQRAEVDIRRVIGELDGMMEREFRKTFEDVAREFKVVFGRLFGGGSAKLILTTPDDLTNTGVEIEARLPGRRPQELSLLSGGERSLTASALIFSLLKVSPTPFCVLDEVDAMLDEANIYRFADLLRDLSTNTQFIIITHNRNTIQVADTIYGVTMGPDSTSQVLSLKLDEVAEQLTEMGN